MEDPVARKVEDNRRVYTYPLLKVSLSTGYRGLILKYKSPDI